MQKAASGKVRKMATLYNGVLSPHPSCRLTSACKLFQEQIDIIGSGKTVEVNPVSMGPRLTWVSIGRHGICLEGIVATGRHGGYCKERCLLHGMVFIGRYGIHWKAWCLLKGMASVGRHGVHWKAWCLSKGMMSIGRHGGYLKAWCLCCSCHAFQ